MEKTWEEFCVTGKVTDYLAYCSSAAKSREKTEEQEEKESYGTVRCVDGDGTDGHAYS